MSKEEYDTCTVNSNARIIAVCDKPHELKYFTVTFRPFTPQPGGLEFHPGDYYFITTSTGDADGLHNKIGGRCASAHMKVTFKVCCKDNTKESTVVNTKQSTPLSSSSSSPFSLPANSNVSNTVIINNSSLMPHHTSPTNSAPGSKATPVMQSLEPSRVLASSTSTVEPYKIIDFTRRPTIPTNFPKTQDIMHSAPPGNTRVHHNPSRTTGQYSGQTHPSNRRNPETGRSDFPDWWKTKTSIKSAPEVFNDPTDRPPGGGQKKGRAWLLIVAAGIAVGVACLIVCFLGVGRRLFIREKHKQSTVINYSI